MLDAVPSDPPPLHDARRWAQRHGLPPAHVAAGVRMFTGAEAPSEPVSPRFLLGLAAGMNAPGDRMLMHMVAARFILRWREGACDPLSPGRGRRCRYFDEVRAGILAATPTRRADAAVKRLRRAIAAAAVERRAGMTRCWKRGVRSTDQLLALQDATNAELQALLNGLPVRRTLSARQLRDRLGRQRLQSNLDDAARTA